MANESVKTYETTVNHVVDGGAVSAGAFSVVGDVDTDLSSANHSDYPYADVVLDVVFASAPTAGEMVYLYRQDLSLVGSTDAPNPTAGYPYKLVGAEPLDAVTSQRVQFDGIPLSKECRFVIKIATASANITATNWDLDVKPWTFVPAT